MSHSKSANTKQVTKKAAKGTKKVRDYTLHKIVYNSPTYIL